MVEIGEVAKTRVESDVQHRFAGGSESQRRFTQPSSQNELIGREAGDLLECSQKVVRADPDERAQFFKAQRPPEIQFYKLNSGRDSTLITNRRGLRRNRRSIEHV